MRSLIFIFIASIIFTCNSLLAISASDEIHIKAMIHTPKLQKINQTDTRIAIELLLQQIASEAEFSTATMHYSEDINTTIEAYLNDTHQIIHIATIDLLEHFKTITSITSQYWAFSKIKGKRLRNFYLLVKSSSDISSLQDLVGKRLALTKFDNMQELYLNTIMLKANKMSYKNIFNNYTYNTKGSTSILNLFFNKVDVAVVSQHSYDIATELNPQLKQQLKILDRSAQIYPDFSLTLIGSSNQYVKDNFKKYSSNLINKTAGKQLLMMYQSVDNFNLSAEELQDIYKHYQEYLTLKKRYEK